MLWIFPHFEIMGDLFSEICPHPSRRMIYSTIRHNVSILKIPARKGGGGGVGVHAVGLTVPC